MYKKKANAHIPCKCVHDTAFYDVTGTDKRDLYAQ